MQDNQAEKREIVAVIQDSKQLHAVDAVPTTGMQRQCVSQTTAKHGGTVQSPDDATHAEQGCQELTCCGIVQRAIP